MLKVAINGPESTGKSVLSEQLAVHFHAVAEPELARNYVEELDRPYTYEDVCTIAKLQIKQQNKYLGLKHPDFVFFDTDLIITKVWFEYKYKQVPEFLLEELQKKHVDFYLLCVADLPWVEDTVRENGDNRTYFFNWYKNEIEKLGTPYTIIQGEGTERLQNAIQAIKIFEATRIGTINE